MNSFNEMWKYKKNNREEWRDTWPQGANHAIGKNRCHSGHQPQNTKHFIGSGTITQKPSLSRMFYEYHVSIICSRYYTPRQSPWTTTNDLRNLLIRFVNFQPCISSPSNSSPVTFAVFQSCIFNAPSKCSFFRGKFLNQQTAFARKFIQSVSGALLDAVAAERALDSPNTHAFLLHTPSVLIANIPSSWLPGHLHLGVVVLKRW